MNDNKELVAILPDNLRRAPTVKGAARAIDDNYSTLWEDARAVLHYPRLGELSSAVLDLLAWQFHVDFYDQTLPVETKRNLILQSIAWHRMKGTPAAVEAMVNAVYASAEVQEWYEYGGDPYHFKVVVKAEPIQEASVLKTLSRAINEVKNVRSWMDPIEFTQSLTNTVYIGAGVFVIKEMIINGNVE